MRFLLISSCAVLALSGCKGYYDPHFMPTGYTYHHNDFKGQPGPKAKSIGYDYSAKANEAAIAQWRDAIQDMLLRARATELLGEPELIYLTTDIKPNAFSSTYDFVLREELRGSGYRISDSPVGAKTLFYSAYDPEESGPLDYLTGYNDEPAHANKEGTHLPSHASTNLVMGWVCDENQHIHDVVSAQYKLPTYGFKPAGYYPPHQRANMPLQPYHAKTLAYNE